MTRRYARTNAEAHFYMDLRPCSCGETRFDRSSTVISNGGVLCSRYAGPCRRCGAPREFVFELPETIRPIRGDGVEFGGADPSRLLDPGEWMAAATNHAKRQPGTREDLDLARAALEEVLKFIPAGAERPPDDAFVTERGRAVRDAEPGRFRRVRIDAVLAAWRDLLAGFASPPASAAADDRAVIRLAEQPLPVLVEALATAAAKQHGFEGTQLRGQVSDLMGQIQALLHMFQIKAAELRQRTKTSVEVDRLLDAIAKTDTTAGRAVAQHRADIAAVFRGIDLAQISSGLQVLVEWLRDPTNANRVTMEQLITQLQTVVAPSRRGDDNKN